MIRNFLLLMSVACLPNMPVSVANPTSYARECTEQKCEDHCGPDVISRYEMSDHDGERTIWAPSLFCEGELALLTALPGNQLLIVPQPSANGTNPGSAGTFSGQFEVVAGTDCNDPHSRLGDIWDVTYTIDAPVAKTEAKGKFVNPDDYQLGLMHKGRMTRNTLSVVFDNRPSDNTKGHQVGLGANDQDKDLGGAFWFNWELYSEASLCRTGKGDFNFDLECLPTKRTETGDTGTETGDTGITPTPTDTVTLPTADTGTPEPIERWVQNGCNTAGLTNLAGIGFVSVLCGVIVTLISTRRRTRGAK